MGQAPIPSECVPIPSRDVCVHYIPFWFHIGMFGGQPWFRNGDVRGNALPGSV